MKFSLGIRASFLIPMNDGQVDTLTDQFVGIEGGRIAMVGKYKESLRKKCKKFIDGRGMVCLPGFVNGHTHMAMTLFRGLEDDVSFHTWLFERILPLEGKLVSSSFVRDGTWLAAAESIRFGVTTLNEMYFYAEETAKVIEKSGLRAIVAQTMADFPLPEDKDLGTDKFAIVEKLNKKFHSHPRLKIAYGPHAPYSCNDDLLKKIAEQSELDGCPIHIHVSETKKEVSDSVAKYGFSPVERLRRLGILKKGTIAAHCVHLSQEDQKTFSKSGASVAHNPDSNCKLGSGVAPIREFIDAGIPWSFGTDGAASNNNLSIYGAMNLGTKMQKLLHGSTEAFGAKEALVAATIGGAKGLGLEAEVGSIEVGKRADLQLVDLQHPHMQPINDIPSHLVYSATGMEVAYTVVEGKVLFANGKFTTLDFKEVTKKAEAWRKKIQIQLAGLKK